MKRNVRLDALKGVVILLVVLSHAMQDYHAPGSYVPLRLLTFVDMPLFMMLTGYALGYARPRAPRAHIAHRARTMLIPYVAWGLIAPLSYGEMPDVFMTLTGRSGPWFLLAVFVFEIGLLGIRRISDDPRWLVGCAWLIGVGAHALVDLPALRSLGLVQDIAHFFVFYVIGYAAFKVLPAYLGSRRRVFLIASSLLVVAGLSVLSYFFLDRLGSLRWVGLAVAISIEAARLTVGLLGGLFAALAIRAVKTDNLRFFAWVGTKSLGIYLIHVYLRHRVTGSGWVAVIAAFFAWVLVSVLGTLIIQRWPSLNALLLGGRPTGRHDATPSRRLRAGRS